MQNTTRNNKISNLYAFQLYYSCEHGFVIKFEMRKDFRFYYFWFYFVYQNFQNGYCWISLFSVYGKAE